MIAILAGVLILGFLIWYVFKCLKQISTVNLEGAEVPVEAIITAWGRAVRVVGQGLHWFWWPKYKVGLLVPTTIRKLEISEFLVHTKKTGKEKAKPLMVGVTVYLTLPRFAEKYEVRADKFPSIWRDCISKHQTEDPNIIIIEGRDLLLKHLYFSLAPDKLFDTNKMAVSFKDAIMDGVRAIMVRYTYTECREQKTQIEEEIKDYLLTDPANLFVKCGIPPTNLDISITSERSTDEVEQSLYAEEVAKIEGKAFQKEIDALVKAGVEKNIAAILAKGVGQKGKAIDFGALSQMGIALRFMGIQPPYQRTPSSEAIEDILKGLPSEKAAAVREILKDLK